MFKKNIGKILFFIFNIFLLIGGIFFIKNRESKKVIENTSPSDSENVETSADIIPNSDPISSADLPVAEEKTVINNTDSNIKSNTAPISISATSPVSTSSASNSKPKTKAS